VAAARLAGEPGNQPSFFQYRSRLLGRVYVQQGSAVMAAEPEGAFDSTFGASGASFHETLPDLQGGAAGEHEHLTADEYAGLQDGSPTALNPVVVNSDARLTNSRAPTAHQASHVSGADQLANLTDTHVAAANKDGLAAVPSMRTIGVGALQAAAGDHLHAGTYQPANANLTTLAGVAPGAGGLAVLDDASVADVRATISVVSRDFGSLAADPAPVIPAANGDTYTHTSIGKMVYDGARAKWVSVAEMVVIFDRDGNTNANVYYFASGVLMSATRGRLAPFNGVVTGIWYTRTDTDGATFEVLASGVATGAELLSGAVSGSTTSLNSNFSAGAILAARNKAGGATTSNVYAGFIFRWRA
jgi:hypothetical protein